MTFWGVEVKSGVPLAVESGGDFMVHLSQACLGEVKKDKGNDSVILSVKVGDKKIVIGTLSSEKFPHLTFDLVFDQDFELSHNGKHGSVYFCGYKMPNQSTDDVTDSETEIEEDLPVATNNGKPASETKKPQPPTENLIAEGKRKVKIVEPKKDDESEEETDDSDYTSGDEDDSSDEDDSGDDKEIKIIGNGKNDEDAESDNEDDESDDEDEESDDESDEEEAPRVLKTEQGKKRSAESSKNTPPPEKKAKFVTPQKTDGKKASVHVSTPHPSKKILKTPASSDQKEQTQKSVSCKTCSRTFGTDVALQSHKKAKHNAV
ncbi:histone deacetylase HDT2-like [Mercurialis annua]|uniref:histone deacetylase HDT2-like n=1 Tax=Mercurialis annua TaxID=3986 RepID=UPI0024AEE798|nr:histone deacetylase HDT2-like [Mercurialis annua]